MTSHELARQLLDLPDAPLVLSVGSPDDTFIGDLGDCKVTVEDIDVESAMARGYPDTKPGNCVRLGGWMSSEEEPEEDEDE